MAKPKTIEIRYAVQPTLQRFHDSDAFVRQLLGPFGSGKTTGCIMEILKRTTEMPHASDGYRRSRWAVGRNTYRELKDTTIQTWNEWVPKDIWHWRESDMSGELKMGDIRAEVLFRSLDTPADVGKLLSLQLTGAWLNESREIPWAIIAPLMGRLGRFPRETLRNEPYWSGLIMDSNPPDTDHWIYRQFEEVQPEGWEIFKQPSGVSREAENIRPNGGLNPNYYSRLIESNKGNDDWIKVYVHGEYGFVQDGKPVYPEYVDSTHCRPAQELPLQRHGALIVGMDFGLTPAAVLCQVDPQDDQWQVIDEVVTEDMGAMRFGDTLRRHIQANYPDKTIMAWGDPAGEQRAQTDEKTVFSILEAQGIEAFPAQTNDFTLRREAVATRLQRLTMLGRPALVISDRCRMLRKAMAGAYKYKRLQVSGDERFHDKPDKGPFSHVAEALQYAMVGEGEQFTMLDTPAMMDMGTFERPRAVSRFR